MDVSNSERDIHDAFSAHSVKIMELAAKKDANTLNGLISEDADWRLGAGDVGLPMGDGVEGALKSADWINPTRYQHFGWDYMDSEKDPCGKVTVDVAFISDRKDSTAMIVNMKFEYLEGQLMKAHGWARSLNEGDLKGAFS